MTFEVGDYRATDVIGVGGSAQVWLGVQISTGAAVALKVFAPDQLGAARREAALAAAVDHPHFVAVLDVVADDERAALITEYAAGGDLADLLARRGRLSPAETLTVLIPLASALSTAHERQIVHGDVSAGNIVFDRAGRPLLTDLGAGRAAAESGLPVAATPVDAAPELARGGVPTAATDLFSLGSVAMACLTGRHAWPADDLRDVLIQAAAGQWPDPGDDAGPAELVAAVRALLEHDPERRPSAASLVRTLRAAGRPEAVDLRQRSAPLGFDQSPARAGAVTMVREDAVPGHAPPDVRRSWFARRPKRTTDPAAGRSRRALSRSVRVSLIVVSCALVAVLAGSAGLWWADQDRSDPVTAAALATASAAPGQARPTSPNPRHVSTAPAAPSHDGSALSRPPGTSSGSVPTSTPAPPTASASGRPSAPVPPESTADPTRSAVATDWTATVRGLDDARAKALVARDAGLLDAVYTSGSPARAADERVIATMLSGGLRVSGAEHVVRAARAAADSPLEVVVEDSLPSYSILDTTGAVVGRTTARGTGSRILVLVRTAAGYRISQVQSA